MNLFKIKDSKAEDYNALASEFPNNFVARLLKVVKRNLPTTNTRKSSNQSTSTKILGNDLLIEYKSSTKTVAVYLNGTLTYKGPISSDTLYNIVKGTIEAEVKGRVSVKRPEGHSLAKDQRELSENSLKAHNINISTRFNSLLKSFGAVAKQGGSNKPILSADAYRYFSSNGSIDESDYINVGNYYIKQSTNLFVMKTDNEPSADINAALAREPGLEEFYDSNIESSKKSYVLSKSGTLYELGKGHMVIK